MICLGEFLWLAIFIPSLHASPVLVARSKTSAIFVPVDPRFVSPSVDHLDASETSTLLRRSGKGMLPVVRRYSNNSTPSSSTSVASPGSQSSTSLNGQYDGAWSSSTQLSVTYTYSPTTGSSSTSSTGTSQAAPPPPISQPSSSSQSTAIAQSTPSSQLSSSAQSPSSSVPSSSSQPASYTQPSSSNQPLSTAQPPPSTQLPPSNTLPQVTSTVTVLTTVPPANEQTPANSNLWSGGWGDGWGNGGGWTGPWSGGWTPTGPPPWTQGGGSTQLGGTTGDSVESTPGLTLAATTAVTPLPAYTSPPTVSPTFATPTYAVTRASQVRNGPAQGHPTAPAIITATAVPTDQNYTPVPLTSTPSWVETEPATSATQYATGTVPASATRAPRTTTARTAKPHKPARSSSAPPDQIIPINPSRSTLYFTATVRDPWETVTVTATATARVRKSKGN